MSFLENVSSTLSKGAGKVKYAAELTKLNGAIASNRKKMRRLYREIGEMYMELYAGCEHEELSALCDEVREHEEAIAALEKDIKRVKGIVICPECGAELGLESRYCNICGSELPIPDEAIELQEEKEEKEEEE